MNDFRVAQIDQVELFVPDQYRAAARCQQLLGIQGMAEYEHWAGKGEPPMRSGDAGRTKLAWVTGKLRGSRQTAGHHWVASCVKRYEITTYSYNDVVQKLFS